MKKILSIILLACLFVSCEDFLDSTNKTKKDTGNTPQTPKDASQLLTGVYSILGRPEPLGSLFMVSELMSDDRFGGGGPDDRSCKAIDQFKKSDEDMFNNSWRAHYFGVFRSNFLITNLDRIVWDNTDQRDKIEGEVHYLRAYFYFDLSRMFGEVPLVTKPLLPEEVYIGQNPAEETYALIASDLKLAIEKLPAIKFQDIDRENDLGRATKWAAEALMARVFLFYTGYYQKSELPLTDGGSITKSQVIEWIDDCIANSGHDLVDDFRNLWPYSYVKDYKYTADNDLKWEGDGNKETVFAIKYSTKGIDWDSPHQKSNQFNLYFGLRGQSSYIFTFPYGEGWGMGTVNSRIWEAWDDNDIRKKASVLNSNDKEEIARYTRGGNNLMEETLYWQKKYMPINVWKNSNKDDVMNYSHELYGKIEGSDYMRDNTQDLVLMRFADVLLMAAELGSPKAQDHFDKVRERVGLPSIPATLDNIKKERRFELAFEGVRYYDLLRWHDEKVLDENQKDVPVYNKRLPGIKTVTFRPETGGFLPIPKTQIDLSRGMLKQNAGWEGSTHYLE